jgi:hypothetical protein
VKLNFSLSEYSDDELAALEGLTQEEVLTRLRGRDRRSASPTNSSSTRE